LPELPLRDAVALGAWALAFDVLRLALPPFAVLRLRFAVLRLPALLRALLELPALLRALLRFEVLPLLAVLRALLCFVLWLRDRPRVVWRLLLLADLLVAPRLLERLEEPRPLVADMVYLLRFDSHPSNRNSREQVWPRSTPVLSRLPRAVDECSTPRNT
jgi:hypothetical protein